MRKEENGVEKIHIILDKSKKYLAIYYEEPVKVRRKRKLTLKPRKRKLFANATVDHMLSSSANADKIYRKVFGEDEDETGKGRVWDK